MTKCEICGDEISAINFRDHLRKCMIFNIPLTYYMEQLHFLKILDAIKKHLGVEGAFSFVNALRRRDYENFFRQVDDNKLPLCDPLLYTILNWVLEGLKSEDEKLFNETTRVLWNFYYEIKRLLSIERYFNYLEDFYLASLLELFNAIYEQNLENYIPKLKGFLELIAKENKDKINRLFYELEITDTKIYFLLDE